MKVSTGFLAVIQAGSYFREFQKNRQKCPRRSGKTITFSDLQTTRRMNRPSEVRMPGGDFAASCCARWSFVISRKLIFPYPPGGEKSGISEIYGFSRFSRSPPYGHRPPFGLPALLGQCFDNPISTLIAGFSCECILNRCFAVIPQRGCRLKMLNTDYA